MRRISFKNSAIEVVGNSHLPNGFDESKAYAALVLVTPGSSVKERVGAIYAEKLASRGFVALTFGPSYKANAAGSRGI